MMNADEIFNDVKLQVFDLLNYGETEVIFGEYLHQKFDVYKNTEYIARLIMHCFARLYLNR